MAASFPTSVKTFTTKTAGAGILSEHVNAIQEEVVAIETELKKTTGSVVDHGGLAGLADNDHTQYRLASVAIDHGALTGLGDNDHTQYGRPVFLTTPLSSTDWDGDARSTTAKTLIDLSTVFGLPAGVKAILVDLRGNDSGSAAGNCLIGLSHGSSAGSYSLVCTPYGLPNDAIRYENGIVPCDANGDIYYQCIATGVGTLDVTMYIRGYWL